MSAVTKIKQYGSQETQMILNCAFDVHSTLGPGLLESVYEDCLFYELQKHFSVQRQVPVSIQYKDLNIPNAFKADIIVNDQIIIELKTVDRVLPIHEAQIIHYMHLAQKPLGLLLNFKTYRLKEGIKRYCFEQYWNHSLSSSL